MFSNELWNKSSVTKGAVDLLEADADSDTFVCEFTGTGNETGAGGGLSGSDLILTEAGTVSDASDGWRTLDDGAFTVTTAWFTNFFSGNTGDRRTLAMHLKNVNVTPDEVNGFFNWIASPVYGWIYIKIPSSGTHEDKLLVQHGEGNANKGLNNTTISGSDLFGSSDEFWLCWWHDGTYDRLGWVEDAPSKWSDFPSGQRISASFDGEHHDTGAGTGYGFGIDNGNICGRFDINRVVMSKSSLIEND